MESVCVWWGQGREGAQSSAPAVRSQQMDLKPKHRDWVCRLMEINTEVVGEEVRAVPLGERHGRGPCVFFKLRCKVI